MKLLRWKSEVRFLIWKLDAETATCYSLMHARAIEGLILSRIHPLLRPFCRVVWIQS